MAGISVGVRDLELTRSGLQRWLEARFPDKKNVWVDRLLVNESTGFSNETIMFSVQWTDEGVEQVDDLVARLAPAGGGLFPEYDLAKQSRVQEIVGRHGIPAAAQLGFEEDDSWVGSPFLMMRRVRGRVAPGQPLYCLAGWVHDESPKRQATLCGSFIDVLADIHSLDWTALDLGFLARGSGVGLLAEWQWWDFYLDWASEGAPPPEIAAAMSWCRERLPANEPAPTLAWGDARLSNMMFSPNCAVAAVLDWEMTTICPPELDFGWYLASRRQIAELAGVQKDPELPGFLSRDRSIERYERRLGRPVDDLRWYEVFAMVRLGICMAGVHRVLRHKGVTDHFVLRVPLLQDWVLQMIDAG